MVPSFCIPSASVAQNWPGHPMKENMIRSYILVKSPHVCQSSHLTDQDRELLRCVQQNSLPRVWDYEEKKQPTGQWASGNPLLSAFCSSTEHIHSRTWNEESDFWSLDLVQISQDPSHLFNRGIVFFNEISLGSFRILGFWGTYMRKTSKGIILHIWNHYVLLLPYY